MSWITTKSGKRVNTDWFDDDEANKQRQMDANKKEADKKQAESDNEITYANDLSKDMKKKAEDFSNHFQATVDKLVEFHNNYDPESDLEDYLWEHIYDEFSLTLPDDMSIFVFDNNRGNYDKDGRIGLGDVRFNIKNNKTASIKLHLSYSWMDDFDDEYLSMMGIEK